MNNSKNLDLIFEANPAQHNNFEKHSRKCNKYFALSLFFFKKSVMVNAVDLAKVGKQIVVD